MEAEEPRREGFLNEDERGRHEEGAEDVRVLEEGLHAVLEDHELAPWQRQEERQEA